jgi:soluble epoxide hydrolase / lipid-phosphate phosphatase
VPQVEITEHAVRTPRHTTAYLAAGPQDGPLVVFVHGWPELAISWRHQLPVLAGLGFRVIAPDMRGYGRSTVHPGTQDYAQEHIVADMIELLDALGHERAVWVGHDWGSPVVWNLASHHPDRCRAVANLCVPYWTLERGLEHTVALVDRTLYPTDRYAAGQWDYQYHYLEHFDRSTAVMDADPYRTVKALFRKGRADAVERPAVTATVRADGGWFGGAPVAPDVPADHDVVTAADLYAYAAALTRNGFRGPNAWYVNHDANAAYAARAVDGGTLSMPVLFLHARYDTVCETVRSGLAAPMREHCRDLTERVIDAGHWMAQERPFEVNAALVEWMVQRVEPVAHRRT